MRSAFKPLLIVLAALVLMVGFSEWQRRRPAPPDNIPWRKDLGAAKREAAEGKKPVLVYFTATWCPPCQQMHHDTWPDPRVGAALKDVVPVRIDVDEQPDVAREFRVSSIPRMQLLHADGSIGPSREGFTSADELIHWLRAPATP